MEASKEKDIEEEEEEAIITWSRETIPRVMKLVSSRLSQRDLISLLLVSPWLHRTLSSYPSLWQVLDFREMTSAGDRLLSALSLARYDHLKEINLEFAWHVEDRHLELLRSKRASSLQNLEILNLNGCQKISDKGIEAITKICPRLKAFSIYWNVKVSDVSVKYLVENCRHVIDLNLSGCKNLSDGSLQLIANNYDNLELLNLTRCIKMTDNGLQQILRKCSSLQSLNLYALSNFSDKAYQKISNLAHLKFLDLCGAQNLSDEGLSCIAKCKNLISLNLTWCVHVTDVGVMAIAEGCTALEFLRFCSETLTTLDVNGCIGIKRRSRDELLKLFPNLKCFKVHS